MATSTTVAEATGALQACVFQLGDTLLAVEVRYAKEVVVVDDYTEVPRAPSHLIGLTNLRGYILPILDIRSLLRWPTPSPARGMQALVLEAGSPPMAVAIDGIRGLTVFDEVLPFGEAAWREYGTFGMGLLRRGNDLATLLDASKVVEVLGAGIRGSQLPDGGGSPGRRHGR